MNTLNLLGLEKKTLIFLSLAIIGAAFLAVLMVIILARKLMPPKKEKEKEEPHRRKLPPIPWGRLFMWGVTETLVIATVSSLPIVNGKTIWQTVSDQPIGDWCKRYWILLLLGHILLGYLVWRGRIVNGHGGGQHISLKETVRTLAMLAVAGFVCYYLYGCCDYMATPAVVREYGPNWAEVRPQTPAPAYWCGVTNITAPVDSWSQVFNIPPGGGKFSFLTHEPVPLWLNVNGTNLYIGATNYARDLNARTVAFRSALNVPTKVWLEISR